MGRIKQVLKGIGNEFVYGGHIIALGAAAVVFTTGIMLDIKVDWLVLIISYLGIYCGYLFNRYQEIGIDKETNFKRTKYLEKYIKKAPWIIGFILLFIVVSLIYTSHWWALGFGIFLLIFGFAYSICFKKITKNVIGFKNIYVGLMWSLLILFAVFYAETKISPETLLLFFIFFVSREAINNIFSDIKDVESDRKEDLLTLAVIMGEKKLLRVLNIVNVFSLIPLFLGVYLDFFPFYSIFLGLSVIYAFYYLSKVKDPNFNKDLLYNFLVEAEQPLWVLFISVGKLIL